MTDGEETRDNCSQAKDVYESRGWRAGGSS